MYPSSQKAPFERELFGNAGRVESRFLYLPDELCLFGKPLIHRADRRPEFLHLGLGKGGHFHTPGPHIFFGLSFPLGPEAALHIGAVPGAAPDDARERVVQPGQLFQRGPAGDLFIICSFKYC